MFNAYNSLASISYVLILLAIKSTADDPNRLPTKCESKLANFLVIFKN